MTTLTISPEAEQYLAAVREELDDLPEEERTDLLEDLAGHLADVTANRGAEEPPLTTLLGAPEQYAAELRAAAGLPARTSSATPAKKSLKDRLYGSFPARFAKRAWRQPPVVKVRKFVPELQPAWWVLRGYLVVALPALAAQNAYDDFPFPTVGGSHLLGILFTALAIVGSVWLGRRPLGKWKRRLVLAGNAFLVMFALGSFSEADYRMQTNTPAPAPFPTPDYVLESRSGPVTNIYPYAADGTPLEGVLLFDQDGRPLRAETQQWWADRCARQAIPPKAADGGPVEFSYPKDYELVTAGPGCLPQVPRPEVPLPVFAEPGEAGPAPQAGDPAAAVSPAEVASPAPVP